MLAALTLLAVLAVPPAPTRWVADEIGLLSPAVRDALDTRLEAYQASSGHQVVVWIGNTLGGRPLDAWAVQTFGAWKLGRKGIDDGIAIFVLAHDRAIDIEVGYGLEDRVPDATASRIIREVMAPRLAAGERDDAIRGGVDAVLAAIEGQAWEQPNAPTREWSIPELVGAALLALVFLYLAIRYPRAALVLLATSLRGAGGSGGGRRGGGGRSGGGGARGGW